MHLTTAVPSPLVCIIVLTIVSVSLGLEDTLRTVGDMGELPASLPMFLLPDVPLNFETLGIILPYAISLRAGSSNYCGCSLLRIGECTCQ